MANSQEWLFTKEFLEDAKADRFGGKSLDAKKEKENRFKTIWFIKDLSHTLRPGSKETQKERKKEEEADFDIRNLKVLWTACAFFHRFFVFHSFDSHNRFAVAVACLFLASKVEEKPLRLSDHIFLYFRLRKNVVLKKTDEDFKKMEQDVLLAERILLQTLGFDLNITHPYQFYRQIIGKDLKAWFSDAEDSKQVLRLATTLLTDSYRSTLCLQYTSHQLACAMVFLALQVMALKPQQPSSGAAMGSIGGGSYASRLASAEDLSWLDFFEKDVEERAMKDICFTMVELYETSFAPSDVPYCASAHSKLRSGIETKLSLIQEAQKTYTDSTSGGKCSGSGSSNGDDRDGVEEFKGSGMEDEGSSGSHKRKFSPEPVMGASSSGSGVSASSSASASASSAMGLTGSGSKSRYNTLPPPFPFISTDTIAVASSSSPCHNAPTPRSSSRPPMRVRTDSNFSDGGIPPPPESPMSSSYSTFSQAFGQQGVTRQVTGSDHGVGEGGYSDSNGKYKEESGVGGCGGYGNSNANGHGGCMISPAVSMMDTPTYMPLPPDTPGSMASTPNFTNMNATSVAEVSHHFYSADALSMAHNAKKARVDY